MCRTTVHKVYLVLLTDQVLFVPFLVMYSKSVVVLVLQLLLSVQFCVPD